MDKELGKEYADTTRREQYLRDNCDSIENIGYMKPFSAEDIQDQKEQLAEVSILINDIETEKRELIKDIKNKIDPMVAERSVLLKGIKEKAEYVREECFKFVDMEAREAGYYNAEGILIESRPALPNELQSTIFQINRKTGTHE